MKNGRFTEAVELFDSLIINDEFVEFLTLPGYELFKTRILGFSTLEIGGILK